MGTWTDQLAARIIDRIENEADSLGLDIVADIREHISNPVVRSDSGRIIQRSAPGDDPWLETGHLSASERHTVETTSASTVQLTILNDAAYARAVHDGHGASGGFGAAEPRPFHDHARTRMVPQILSRIHDAITGKR